MRLGVGQLQEADAQAPQLAGGGDRGRRGYVVSNSYEAAKLLRAYALAGLYALHLYALHHATP